MLLTERKQPLDGEGWLSELKLDGIRCGFKPTSCPDQLAQALKQAQA